MNSRCHLPHTYQEYVLLGVQTEVQSVDWPSYCRQCRSSHQWCYPCHWFAHHQWNQHSTLCINNRHNIVTYRSTHTLTENNNMW